MIGWVVGILFFVFALLNAFFILNIFSLRGLLKRILSRDEGVARGNLGILRRLTSHSPLLREYVAYNAPIFLYPSAAGAISFLCSAMQILCMVVLAYSVVRWNVVHTLLSFLFFFISGYAGSRFNNRFMLKNFSLSGSSFSKADLDQTISEFHANYYRELRSRMSDSVPGSGGTV